MAIPKLISIAREEGYHTDHIGEYADGQYVGFAFFPDPPQRRLVSVLHLFDASGCHISSEAWDSSDGVDPQAELQKAIDALPEAQPGNVKVAPFSVEFFGTSFGMIPINDDRVDYLPYGLAFFPPWNGLYDT